MGKTFSLLSFSLLILILTCHATRIGTSASLHVKPRSSSSSEAKFVKSQTERLIRQLNLFPELDVNIAPADHHYSSELLERRFRFKNVLSESPGASVEDLGHHAGYYRLPNTKSARMFYFFFESRRNRTDDPVVIWLTGGPGCASELALFYENGPYQLTSNLSLAWNDYGWDKPTGTGFSYTNHEDDIRGNGEDVSNDLYDFLQAFFTEHFQYAKNDFYITGESYAGHYIPALASRIHEKNKESKGIHINLKGFAIGNGMTHPAIQYTAHPDYALQMKLIKQSDYDELMELVPQCEAAAKECVPGSRGEQSCITAIFLCEQIFENILSIADDINVRDREKSHYSHVRNASNVYYDVRKKCEGELCYDFSGMKTFLNKDSVRKALGVGDIEFVSCSSKVHQAMITDLMRNWEVVIPPLLEDGIRFLAYAGEYDLICNWLGNSRWIQAMKWSGQKEYGASPSVGFVVDGKEAGVSNSFGPLTFLKVHDAGHMVPMDQPKASLEMLQRWIQGNLSAPGQVEKLLS
ncbi:Peptidase S10, serine carboxypeptidase [Dillenia turbinata]|uniref:Carboxypeptidase n=1 Tax=Dillenia turbinata TaxID=194707 RepID=A0AAN8Z6H1_9MAGN